MIIWLVVWDSDAGTSVEHYASKEARDQAIRNDLLHHWDEDEHGPAPVDYEAMWEVLSRWADYWFYTEEINLKGNDTGGHSYPLANAA